MPSTPQYAIPYPSGTDRVMDGDNVMQAIAERVEALLKQWDPAIQGAASGRRNYVRNGDMSVAQRGGGPFTAAGVYTLDGWIKNHTGGTHQVDRGAVPLGSGVGINGAGSALQSAVAGQAAAADYALVQQPIESVRSLAGQKVTVSFVAVAAAGAPKIGIEIVQSFGTGGSPSADVLTALGTVTLSTTPTRVSLTFTVPSIVGKTAGTGGNDRLWLNLWLSAGTTQAARASNIGIQNSTINITDVQLEVGEIATPFERLSLAAQLAWCQRYFHRLGPFAAARQHGVIHLTQNNGGYVHLLFPVRMRAEPTVSYRVVGDFQTVDHAANGQTVDGLAVGYAASEHGARFSVSGPYAGYVPGQVSELSWANVGNAWLAFSAEL